MNGHQVTLEGGPRHGETLIIFGGTSLHWPDAVYRQAPHDPAIFTVAATRQPICATCGHPRSLANGKGQKTPRSLANGKGHPDQRAG